MQLGEMTGVRYYYGNVPLLADHSFLKELLLYAY